MTEPSFAKIGILAVVDDMFFASKIRGCASQLGHTVTFAKSFNDVEKQTASEVPALIVIDLNCARLDPIQLIRHFK
ncbi:MAG TPA: hypothetical protein VJX67_18325, partial [Blastocatellia bacterium]|nr:hypothetical protein [Blastocatellia bacterium]